ncbi:MAG: hypothetical protein ACW9XH_05275 [Candidatus Nitrosopumilus sp. bin_32a]
MVKRVMNTCKNCQEVFELEVPYNGKYSIGCRIYQCPKCGFIKIKESIGSNRKLKKTDFEKAPNKALAILQEKYAKGEIAKKEFYRIKDTLK